MAVPLCHKKPQKGRRQEAAIASDNPRLGVQKDDCELKSIGICLISQFQELAPKWKQQIASFERYNLCFTVSLFLLGLSIETRGLMKRMKKTSATTWSFILS